MSIELTAQEIHAMPVIELKEFHDSNTWNLYEEIDEIDTLGIDIIYLEESESESIFCEAIEEAKKIIKAKQSTIN